METEVGKRFLSASPIPLATDEQPSRMPNTVARVLTPMQCGVVLTLLGIGLLLLRNAGPNMGTPMTVLGTVILMPGIGFILSAGATWIIAQRLGPMPEKADAHTARSGVAWLTWLQRLPQSTVLQWDNLRSSMAADPTWSLMILLPVFGTLALLGGAAVYLATDRQ